jgi:hypothetical protein
MDRDLDMLIEPQDDDDEDNPGTMDVDMGVVVGVDHDDLAKMSVGRLLSAPDPGEGKKDDGDAGGKGRGSFDVDYGTPG